MDKNSVTSRLVCRRNFSMTTLTPSAGGSTIVVLFEKDVVQWDDDLINNGRSSLETLVQVGMGIGRSRLSSTFQF